MRRLLWMLPIVLAIGCKAKVETVTEKVAGRTVPARPVAAPAAFKVAHQQDNTAILVVPEAASDESLAALLWELRDAADGHGFDQLGLSQKWADARSPIVFVHVYRGPRCAAETYTKGAYPCGASYHGAADFSFGGFTHHDATDGYLVGANGNPQPHLWSEDEGGKTDLKERP